MFKSSCSSPEILKQPEQSKFEIAPGRWVGDNHPCFIIAEIGQNHQGDIEIAKKLIEVAKECGADCVKFQKSDLQSRFTSHILRQSYSSGNSFGKTYGEHRAKLELSEEQYLELSHFSAKHGIYFSASGMDLPSIDFLHKLDVPFFKIGSADCTNLPLLRHAISYKKPLIISTGMSFFQKVAMMYEKISKLTDSFALMQCTSAYPANEKDVNLNVIKTYKEHFPKAVIGYSGHEHGIGISCAAVAVGAKILERHITLDHNMKGTDHKASLEPSELKQLVTEVRRVENAMGSYEKEMLDSEQECYKKLGKIIVAAQDLPRDQKLNEDMIEVKVAAKPDEVECDPIFYDEISGAYPVREFKAEEPLVLPDVDKLLFCRISDDPGFMKNKRVRIL